MSVGDPILASKRSEMSVGDPILASKITAPGVPDWVVPRPRITELIAQGMRWCPLTIANGPAGAGKTMALALWAAAEPGPVAWVGLDEYDNEPEVFWSYVVAALRRSGIAVPAALPAAARGREVGHLFLLRLAAALAAQDPPVSLVLDDLHLLTSPQVLDGLDYVLRNTGGGLRLVASARMDPPLPLHRYRVAGELAEIRAGDLAFTVPEAGLLLARHGITLTADALECLTRRTEGWAVGLRLAAISMRSHPDPDQFVTELITDDSALTGYLVAEALKTQPPEARDVLLSTSILEQVSAQTASELTGNEQAPAILPAMAHANGFIQPTSSGWYRYHPLFAEVLRLKLSREYPDRRAMRNRARAGFMQACDEGDDEHHADDGDPDGADQGSSPAPAFLLSPAPALLTPARGFRRRRGACRGRVMLGTLILLAVSGHSAGILRGRLMLMPLRALSCHGFLPPQPALSEPARGEPRARSSSWGTSGC